LVGKPNSTHRSEGRYWLPIQQIIEGYKRVDPPAQAKLAVHIKVVNHIHDVGQVREMAQAMAIADMCLIAFYFLRQVGEYTAHRKGAKRRTQQFRAKDITFWDKDLKVIPNDSSIQQVVHEVAPFIKGPS
jgi:hypothetical protein